jgi:nudix-type nucleoside diphosphatase (YffH/AdpP family)
VLSHDWYLLRKITFDYQRNNGEWQRQTREVYDRGNGAAILLYNREKKTVVLTRQFRLPVFVNGHDGLLIEVAAGLLEGAAPQERIRAEAEEETGYRVHHVQPVFEAFMSPGSVTEKLHFSSPNTMRRRRSAKAAGWRKRRKNWKCWNGPSMKRSRRFIVAKSAMRRPSCCCSMRR